MATFGANYPCFCADGKDSGAVIGKLVSANLTVNLASGELYADDSLAEQATEFANGSIAMETDDMADATAEEVYGCSVNNGEVVYNKDDNSPRGRLGYYKVLMRRGVKYFKTFLYPQVKAAIGNDNAQTKGNNITFGTTSTTFTVFADDNGDWRKTKTFDSAADAKAHIDLFCKISQNYEVQVSMQGAGEDEGVSKTGYTYVASGEDFTLTIIGTPTKVYDNGSDVTSSVSDGVYTISDVSANHSIAVIF